MSETPGDDLDPIARLSRIGVVPVAVIADAATASSLGAALQAGGLPCVEVTLRTASSMVSLAALAEDPALLVGAGTVTRAEQVDEVLAAGARFVVSPGFSPAVVEAGRQAGVPVLPGVATATEVMAALDAGCDNLKFFPAEASGGLPVLSALAAPFRHVRFVPTGGITEQSLPDWSAHPAVLAVGGSWMVADRLLAQGRFDEVTRLAAAAVQAVGGVRAERAQEVPQ